MVVPFVLFGVVLFVSSIEKALEGENCRVESPLCPSFYKADTRYLPR
jgi:hypothetical protein